MTNLRHARRHGVEYLKPAYQFVSAEHANLHSPGAHLFDDVGEVLWRCAQRGQVLWPRRDELPLIASLRRSCRCAVSARRFPAGTQEAEACEYQKGLARTRIEPIEHSRFRTEEEIKQSQECKRRRASCRLADDFELGVGQHEPLAAGVVEIHLHSCIVALAFIIQHDALAELAMNHPLA